MRPAALISLATALLLSSCASHKTPAPSKQEQSEILGAHACSAMTWTKVAGPDFNVYHGYPKPPRQGEVGFYVGGHPSFNPDKGSTTHAGRLGIYKVSWHRKSRSDGKIYQTAVFPMGEYHKVHVWVYAPSASDLETLTQELATVHLFTRRGPTSLE